MIKKKTNNGTISARTIDFEDENIHGICVGLYGKISAISLESDGNELRILINDDMVKEDNIKIYHVNNVWETKD